MPVLQRGCQGLHLFWTLDYKLERPDELTFTIGVNF